MANLKLKCDCRDNSYIGQRVQINIFNSSTGGPEVIEVFDKNDGTTRKTFPRQEHNNLVSQITRLVEL